MQKMGNGKVLHYSDIPQEVRIVLGVEFDQEDCHYFGTYDSSVTAENYDFCIQLSVNMLSSVRNDPKNTHQNMLIGVIMLHEFVHILIKRQILHVKQTPNKFKKDNDVKDFGYFVERAMFKALDLQQ
jgi:hypothetical protein